MYVTGRDAPWILIEPGERYSIAKVYSDSLKSRDPYECPHGHFRELNHGDHGSALGFLQQFGPLNWFSARPPKRPKWIDLSDFWARHARFVAVAMLWENRGDALGTRKAWRHICSCLDEISKSGYPFGAHWLGLAGRHEKFATFISFRQNSPESLEAEIDAMSDDEQ